MKESKIKTSKIRNSNFEILRILAMIMIVAHHFTVHGGFKYTAMDMSFNHLFIEFIKLGGKIGVNIFILISGYFMITAKSIKLNKILKLWFQIFLYSILFYLAFTIIGHYKFNIFDFLQNCLPIIYGNYWFASVYFLLYLSSPFINKFANGLSKKEYKKLLLLLFIIWSVIPTILNKSLQYNSLLWFCFVYLLAGYIRLHYTSSKASWKKYLVKSTISYFLLFIVMMLLIFLTTKWSWPIKYAKYIFGMNNIFVLIVSVFIFLLFKNIKLKNIQMINVVATSTFGVYLIHDNPFVRKFLWKTVFHNATYSSSTMLIPYAIMCILIVYILSTVVELLRIYILEKPFISFLTKHEDKINSIKNKILLKLGIS